MPFSFWASVPVPADEDHAGIFARATGRSPDTLGYDRPVYFDGRLYVPGVEQSLLEAALGGGAAPSPIVRYVPIHLVRQRLEAAGLWEATAQALVAAPPLMLKVLSLEAGLATNDPDALAMLTAVGADPAEILAP